MDAIMPETLQCGRGVAQLEIPRCDSYEDGTRSAAGLRM